MKLAQDDGVNWWRFRNLRLSGEWRRCTNSPVPLGMAEAFSKYHRDKGREAHFKRWSFCSDGTDGYEVWAKFKVLAQIRSPATLSECLKKNVTPGPLNRDIIVPDLKYKRDDELRLWTPKSPVPRMILPAAIGRRDGEWLVYWEMPSFADTPEANQAVLTG